MEEANTYERQLAMVEGMLASHKDKDYLIVIGHHDVVTCGGGSPGMRRLTAMFEMHKVSAYIYGHRHSLAFSRKNGVMFIQSGAGGQIEPPCPEAQWACGGVFGFAHVLLDAKRATVEWYTSYHEKLHTEYGPRRVV